MTDTTHSRTVRRRFAAAAPTYHDLARVQRTVADKLVRLLPFLPNARYALEVGCGTGILTRHLLEQLPNAELDAIDISAPMIAQARQPFRDEPRIVWTVADARSFRTTLAYDIIASNCSLHWIDPLLEGLEHLVSLLRHGGLLVSSIMLHNTLNELHETRLEAAPDKPPAGRLPRMVEVIDSLELCGCDIEESYEETEVEFYPNARSFLRTIHDMGLTGGAVSRAEAPLTRGELTALAERYDQLYSVPGGVRATFHVGYVRARRR